MDDDSSPTEDFWSKVIGLCVLQPAVNLTSLNIASSAKFGSLIRLDLNSITCPCLTSLSLTNFVWDDGRVDPQVVVPEAENFVVRHGKTPKKLELNRCIICVPHDRFTPARTWASVWNRFAEELTELVDLVLRYNFHRVVQAPLTASSCRVQRRYILYLPRYGFSLDSAILIRDI